MYCPNCKFEYEAGVFKCPDCDEYLVDQLPCDDEYPEENEFNWVQLARLNSDQYAEMLKEVLEKKNIPVILHSGAGHFGITGQMGVTSRPVGGAYSILVPEEFVVEADNEGLAILGEEWEKARLIEIEIEEEEDDDEGKE